MKNIPKFLRDPFRSAWRLTLREITESQEDHVRSTRGWKLLMLLPRMLLYRPPRGGNASKQKLNQRFDDFAKGRWASLLEASRSSTEAATTAQHWRRRRHGTQTNEVEKRAAKALMMVQMGELSSARQALEGAELAPGTPATLAALRDPTRRPDQPRDPIPPALMDLVPRSFELDEVMFEVIQEGCCWGSVQHDHGTFETVVRVVQGHPFAVRCLPVACCCQHPSGGQGRFEVGTHDCLGKTRRRGQRDCGRRRDSTTYCSHHCSAVVEGSGGLHSTVPACPLEGRLRVHPPHTAGVV